MVNIYDPNDDAPEGGAIWVTLIIFVALVCLLVGGVWLLTEGVVW